MQTRRLLPVALFACLLATTIACGGADSPTAEPSATPNPEVTATPTPGPADLATVSAHRFVRVGSAITVDELGEVLEVTSAGGGDVLAHDASAGTVTCSNGGAGFVRARYRPDDAQKNRIQTVAVVCVDETGECEGQQAATLDLEKFREGGPGGEANYLAQGSGELYGVCVVDGRYRLQQAPEMPPLMLRLIDALGNGPYTISGDDLALLDNVSFVNYSGQQHDPARIATVGPEIQGLLIDPDGTVWMNEVNCNADPSCIHDPRLVESGDMLVINFGVDLPAAVAAVPAEVIRQFVSVHIDFDWSGTEGWSDAEAPNTIVYRLVGLEIMDRLLDSFDRTYGLRNSGVMIGYSPYWATRARVTDRCAPDGPEREACETVEALLDEAERERIAEWRAAGFDLWHFDSLAHHPDGEPRRLIETAPSFDAFAGVAVSIEMGAPLDSGDRAEVLRRSMESMAEEVGDQPVIVSANWGPMQFVVDGTQCEAEICEPAFSRYYELHEPLIAAMLDLFPASQLKGFGVALFDGGMHFDIRQPVEDYGGFSLNRVGETGFNSPLLNLYLAH